MQKQIKILLTILMALALAVSCAKNNPNDPNTPKTKEEMLQQKWEYATSAGSGYNITADKIDGFYTENNQEKLSYSVSIEGIVWYSDNKSGMIYGKYITAPSYNQGVANKYYAFYFKNLTADSISISGAYKDGGVSGTSTLAEAKIEFTEVNGYFDIISDCKVVK